MTYVLFTRNEDSPTWWRHDYPTKAERWTALETMLPHVAAFSLEPGPGSIASDLPSATIWSRAKE